MYGRPGKPAVPVFRCSECERQVNFSRNAGRRLFLPGEKQYNITASEGKTAETGGGEETYV